MQDDRSPLTEALVGLSVLTRMDDLSGVMAALRDALKPVSDDPAVVALTWTDVEVFALLPGSRRQRLQQAEPAPAQAGQPEERQAVDTMEADRLRAAIRDAHEAVFCQGAPNNIPSQDLLDELVAEVARLFGLLQGIMGDVRQKLPFAEQLLQPINGQADTPRLLVNAVIDHFKTAGVQV